MNKLIIVPFPFQSFSESVTHHVRILANFHGTHCYPFNITAIARIVWYIGMESSWIICGLWQLPMVCRTHEQFELTSVTCTLIDQCSHSSQTGTSFIRNTMQIVSWIIWRWCECHWIDQFNSLVDRIRVFRRFVCRPSVNSPLRSKALRHISPVGV